MHLSRWCLVVVLVRLRMRGECCRSSERRNCRSWSALRLRSSSSCVRKLFHKVIIGNAVYNLILMNIFSDVQEFSTETFLTKVSKVWQTNLIHSNKSAWETKTPIFASSLIPVYNPHVYVFIIPLARILHVASSNLVIIILENPRNNELYLLEYRSCFCILPEYKYNNWRQVLHFSKWFPSQSGYLLDIWHLYTFACFPLTWLLWRLLRASIYKSTLLVFILFFPWSLVQNRARWSVSSHQRTR